jgi:hypothetical protein
MTTDLEKAFDALHKKAPTISRLFAYYDGEQPTVYTARRLAEIFKEVDAVFIENWCSVVIDSVRDRINLKLIGVPEAVQDTWNTIWEGSQIELDSDDVHEAALVAGEAYYIAWPDQDGAAQGFANDPRLCHVFYDAANPRIKRFAAKWWVTDDETLRMTLYYPDRLEYYGTTQKADSVSKASAFLPLENPIAANPYGEIPVFHFRPVRRRTKSDLGNVIPVQNGINKLLADMMVAAEYGAFKQRYVISSAETIAKLKNAPNEVWDLPAGDGIGQQTQVGQFDATPLDNYLKAIDNLSMAVSSITRTPKHYFFSIGSNLSGEALNAMEAPLNKKAQDRIDRFLPEWRSAARFLLKIAGLEVPASEIHPKFDRPEVSLPRTEAETTDMEVRSGMPLATSLRRRGWSDADIQQMVKDKQEEDQRSQVSLGQALLDAQRRFDGGGNQGGAL